MKGFDCVRGKDGNVIGSKITFSLVRWDNDAGSLSE